MQHKYQKTPYTEAYHIQTSENQIKDKERVLKEVRGKSPFPTEEKIQGLHLISPRK